MTPFALILSCAFWLAVAVTIGLVTYLAFLWLVRDEDEDCDDGE